MHWIRLFTCFLFISFAMLSPCFAIAANSLQTSLSPCEQTQTANDGYTSHQRIEVSAHPAFRPLCIPVYQDTMLLAGEDTQAYITLVGFQHDGAATEPTNSRKEEYLKNSWRCLSGNQQRFTAHRYYLCLYHVWWKRRL